MRVDPKAVVLQTVVLIVIFALALFVPAGTIAWPAGWLFLAMFFGFFTFENVWLFQHNPGLLQERLRMRRPDQKGWDKLLFPVLLIFPFIWLAFTALDAVRFQWSSMALWVQAVGAVVLLSSFYLFFLTFRENSYLSTVVRVQEERGHTVISTGPYRYVRHPMYAGIILFMVGTPLLLASWVGLLLSPILWVLLAWRAVMEERTLVNDLQGYMAYTAQVKYRFITFVY